MRWLIDEGVPRSLAGWLADRGDDVLFVGASHLQGSDDDVLWEVAVRERRMVITRDLGFVPDRARSCPPGLIVLRAPNNWRAQAIVGFFRDGLASLSPNALRGMLTVIQPGRVRQRQLTSIVPRRPNH